MAQLMPLPLTVSCFSEIQIGFTFLVPAHPGSPRKRAVKRVCVYLWVIVSKYVKKSLYEPILHKIIPKDHIGGMWQERKGFMDDMWVSVSIS